MKAYNPNLKIREVKIGELNTGGDTSFSFMSENDNKFGVLTAIEIPFIYDNSYPDLLKEHWNSDNFEERLKKADSTDADIISIKFNIQDIIKDDIINAVKTAESTIRKPIIFRGANNSKIDRIILPIIAKTAKKPSIIAFGEEDTYSDIVPSVIEAGHILSLRSPIDINIAKELNILSTDMGLPAERLLIDPDMGGLGYGLEYGYSIIERIKQAGFDGDNMLNIPIIAFIGEESYRTKEAKSSKFPEFWGDYATRAKLWEVSAASALISAGANIVVLWHPENINAIKELTK